MTYLLKLPVDSDGTIPDVVAYTDGGANSQLKIGAWACLIGTEMQSGLVIPGTNNQCEMLAMQNAIERTPMGQWLHIYTDSRIARGMVYTGWRGQAEHIIELGLAIRRLKEAKGIRLTCTLIPGHSGIPGNSRVDSVAKGLWKSEVARRAMRARTASSGARPTS